MKQTNEFEE